MDYFTLSITGLGESAAGLAERISLIAWQAGCGGIEEPQEQPPHIAAEPGGPMWRIFFDNRDAAEQCRDQLAALLEETGADGATLEIEARASENWMAGWRDYFHPVRVGERFVVAPPWWDAASPDDGDLAAGRAIIRIEPGMAFGTGTHATTQLCLELAEPHLRQGLRVLDVGMGSGILLIAAALQGASPAVAIDNDPETIENFRLNLDLNGLRLSGAAVDLDKAVPPHHPAIHFHIGEGIASLNHLRFDLVFANLLAPHIEFLLAQMREPRFAADAARPLIIGSGLLADEWPALRGEWRARFGLNVEREVFRAEWMAFAGRLVD